MPSASSGGQQQPVAQEDLPPELRDLRISEDGFLIDGKSGKVINEFGATRFDVSVRALRGELNPPDWVENTERSPGLLLGSLFQFPREYLFQVVGKVPAGDRDAFVSDIKGVVGRCCQVPLEGDGALTCSVTERLGGKYLSLCLEAVVRAPEIVSATYDELAKDPRVLMRF